MTGIGDSPVMVVDTAFILADLRYKSLGNAGKVLTVTLLARSFREGDPLLPVWYDTKAIVDDSGLNSRSVNRWLPILEQKGLVKRERGRIRVTLGKGTAGPQTE